MSLVLLGKAEALVQHPEPLRTPSGCMSAPSVVKLNHIVRRPMPELRLSRHSVLARDNYTCQYCGAKGHDLTLDHVIPRWRGGPDSWDNLVACCRKCNLKKGDKTPQQARMKLARKPGRPHFVPYISLPQYLKARRETLWQDYLPIFGDLGMDGCP